jgi:hypothetical protein
MDQGFRFLVLAGFTFLAFICVIRIVLGKQYRNKGFMVDITGILTVFGSFLTAGYGKAAGLPEYLRYVIPVALAVCLPPLSLRMNSGQILKYLALGILVTPVVHILFSLLLGWNDMLPFIAIPSLWAK